MAHPLSAVTIVLAIFSQAVAGDLTVLTKEIGGDVPSEMMHGYLMGRAESALDRRDAEYEKINTPEDVMVCARFLTRYNVAGKPNGVHLVSIGRIGPVALHAVALEPQLFASVKLQNSLVAWASLLETPLAKNQFMNVVHGALTTYDLPDLLTTLPAGKLTVVDPVEKLE